MRSEDRACSVRGSKPVVTGECGQGEGPPPVQVNQGSLVRWLLPSNPPDGLPKPKRLGLIAAGPGGTGRG
jgi:hypothetical protein